MKKFNKKNKEQSNSKGEVPSIDFGNQLFIAHRHSAQKAEELASGVTKRNTVLDSVAHLHHNSVVSTEVNQEEREADNNLDQTVIEARQVLQEWFNETNLGIFLQDMNMGMGDLYHNFLDVYTYDDAPWEAVYISYTSFKKAMQDLISNEHPKYSSYLR